MKDCRCNDCKKRDGYYCWEYRPAKKCPHHINRRVARLDQHGYTCIHIFGDLYLARNYGKSRKFAFYTFNILKDDLNKY